MKISFSILFILFPVSSFAGGGPLNTLVVANASSQDSLEVAQYYQSVRGLPGRNLCRVYTTTNTTISLSNFVAQIQQPIYDWIDDRGLNDQIDFIALSRDIPYRIEYDDGSKVNYNGITSALFYGFKEYPGSPVCTLPASGSNEFYEAEYAFSFSDSLWGSNRVYLSSVLSGWTLQDSLDLIDRSVLSDQTYPAGNLLLIRSSDPFRNVRWPQFEETDYQGRFQSYMGSRTFLTGSGFNTRSNITGASIGVLNVGGLFNNNTFQPGALADHLTSYGGVLFEEFGSQMSILDWLLAGASGSYGTVIEPCNYTEKFPQIRVHNWYARGFNLAESYMMSIEAPYMGVIVGDPLTQPYADLPDVQFVSLTNDQVVSGSPLVEWEASAEETVRVGEVAFYVDGLYSTQLFQAVTSTGISYIIELGSNVISGELSAGLNREQILGDISTVINASNTDFFADSKPGRVPLFQTALRTPASNELISVSLTDSFNDLYLEPVFTNFLESEFSARMLIGIRGNPETGDVVRAVITRLDGVEVTNSIVSLSSNDTAKTLTTNLLSVLQANPDLTGPIGCTVDDYQFNTFYGFQNLGLIYLTANTPGWTGGNMRIDFDVISGSLSNTSVDTYFDYNEAVMSGRGEFQAALGPTSTVSSFVWNTASLPNGPHNLQLLVKSGQSAEGQKIQTLNVVVSNSPFTAEFVSPTPMASYLLGENVTGSVDVTGGSVTNLTLYADGNLVESGTGTPFSFSFSSVDFGVGDLELQAMAEGAGDSAVTEKVMIQLLENDDVDFDGLADDWEQLHFGSITNQSGVDDFDEDGQNNRYEFCSGTQPTNENHLLTFFAFSQTGETATASFYSGSGVVYRVEKTESLLFPGPLVWTPTDTVTAQNIEAEWVVPLAGTSTGTLYRLNVDCPSLISDIDE